MSDSEFVLARPPRGGEKRMVPRHYLKPPFNFKEPASLKKGEVDTVTEPAASSGVDQVTEPDTPDNKKKEARS